MRHHDTLPKTSMESPEERTMIPCAEADALEEAAASEALGINEINQNIDNALRTLFQSTDSVEIEVWQEVLKGYATELAALVLPKEACDELNVHPTILDNQSFYHPPHREDVLRLAASAEATGDPTISSAFQRSISELPEEAKKLFEQALELNKSDDYSSFFESLIALELEKCDGDLDSSKFNTAFAYNFLDHGTLDAGVDYNTLDQGDPRLERLVQPVASSIEGKYGTKESPRVEFYVPKATPRDLGKPALFDAMQVYL
jgi:hypothetical protein